MANTNTTSQKPGNTTATKGTAAEGVSRLVAHARAILAAGSPEQPEIALKDPESGTTVRALFHDGRTAYATFGEAPGYAPSPAQAAAADPLFCRSVALRASCQMARGDSGEWSIQPGPYGHPKEGQVWAYRLGEGFQSGGLGMPDPSPSMLTACRHVFLRAFNGALAAHLEADPGLLAHADAYARSADLEGHARTVANAADDAAKGLMASLGAVAADLDRSGGA